MANEHRADFPDVLTAVSEATVARARAAVADTAAWAAVNGLPPPPRDLPVRAADEAACAADTVWSARAWAARTLLHARASSRSGRVCVARGGDRSWATVVHPPCSPGEWQEVLAEAGRRAGAGPVVLVSPWRTPDLRGSGWEPAGYPALSFRRPGGRSSPPPGLEVSPAGPGEWAAWLRRLVTPADVAADATRLLDAPWDGCGPHPPARRAREEDRYAEPHAAARQEDEGGGRPAPHAPAGRGDEGCGCGAVLRGGEPGGCVPFRWLARRGDEVVGAAAGLVAEGLWLPALPAVEPGLRGQGIAGAMLQACRPHADLPSLVLAASVVRAPGYRGRERWIAWRRAG